jgi:hypothetical protein
VVCAVTLSMCALMVFVPAMRENLWLWIAGRLSFVVNSSPRTHTGTQGQTHKRVFDAAACMSVAHRFGRNCWPGSGGDEDDDDDDDDDDDVAADAPSVWLVRKCERGPVTRGSPQRFVLDYVQQHTH